MTPKLGKVRTVPKLERSFFASAEFEQAAKASMPAPFEREREFEVEHRTDIVPDINRQLLAIAPQGADGISGHFGKRARRLFSHLLYS
ncbi:hypothetical protein IVB34_19980 [Bradyrhizobium sp. 2]|nr:hypothetical protein [Bradyrhizobium sp. 48]MCK1460594.1 hypothetical protein [Bradyrhizobium sp. 2]